MKKKFQKLSKIIFIIGVATIIAMIIILANSGETIEGIGSYILLACLVVAVITIIFAILNFVVALIEGMKKNPKGFIKRFVVQLIVMMIIYIILHFTDDVTDKIDILNIFTRSIALSVGIIGGEYMITDHKNEGDGIHF